MLNDSDKPSTQSDILSLLLRAARVKKWLVDKGGLLGSLPPTPSSYGDTESLIELL